MQWESMFPDPGKLHSGLLAFDGVESARTVHALRTRLVPFVDDELATFHLLHNLRRIEHAIETGYDSTDSCKGTINEVLNAVIAFHIVAKLHLDHLMLRNRRRDDVENISERRNALGPEFLACAK